MPSGAGEKIREAVALDRDGLPYVDFTRQKISRGMVRLSGMAVKRTGVRLIITHSPRMDCRYGAQGLLAAGRGITR